METTVIEQQISINASPEKVWEVFTNPVQTRKMGGEYATDWQPGSSFGWKSSNGEFLTNGVLLECVPLTKIRHNLHDPSTKSRILSVITYTFTGDANHTLLQASEVFEEPLSGEQYDDALQGWNLALRMVKEIAEQ